MTKQASHNLPEMTGFVLCSRCVSLALRRSKEAKRTFKELKQALILPESIESIEAIRRLKGGTPEGPEMISTLIRECEVLHSKDGMPKGNALVKGALNITERLAKKRQAKPAWWRFRRKPKSEDNGQVVLACKLIDDFIRIGFNRKVDRARGTYKVTGTRLLFFTVAFMAMGDVRRVQLSRLGRIRSMPLARQLFSIEEVRSGRVTDDAYRDLTKELGADGFVVKSDHVMADQACHWYQSRVTFSGPTEYCNKEDNGLHVENVNREIRACDVAMGYPRKGTGEDVPKPEESEKIRAILNASILLDAFAALESVLEQYAEYWKSQNKG